MIIDINDISIYKIYEKKKNCSILTSNHYWTYYIVLNATILCLIQ